MSDWWSADPIAGAAPQASSLAPAHRDLAIRTIYGEAANEPDEGQAAVAAVIRNRMQAGRYGGDSVPGVVLAKNQFEPWWNNEARQRLMALKPDDPRYQKIGGIVDQVFGGQMEDPTGGATHFVAPAAQAALGRQMPSWAQGEGLPIGRHTFFAPEGRVQSAKAQGGEWWANDPVAGQEPQQPAPVQHNTDGLSDRVAREGMSEMAPPPKTLGEKLSGLWEKPPPGGLVSMVKPIVQGAATMMQAGHGDIPMTDDSGHTNPAVINASFDVAKAIPMGGAPGGIFAARVGQGVPVRAIEQPKVIPSVQELKTAGAEALQSPAIKTLEIKPTAISSWAQQTKSALNESGLDDTLAQGTHTILSKLEKAPEGAVVTGQNISSLRKTLSNASKEMQPNGVPTQNAAAATQAMKSLDELIPSIKPNDVLGGDLVAAVAKWNEGRANYSAGMHAASIDKEAIRAELRAAAANSGQNVANTVRQRMASLMIKPGGLNGFTQAERAMIEEIVRGSSSQNAVRTLGNAMGGGLGVGGTALGIGGAMAAGPAGAAIPFVGYALKSLSNRMTLTQAAKLSEAIRSRAPLANAMNDFGAKATEFSQAQTPRAVAAVNLAARNLSNNLRDAGITMSPGDLLRSLTGPMKSAADNEQPNP